MAKPINIAQKKTVENEKVEPNIVTILSLNFPPERARILKLSIPFPEA